MAAEKASDKQENYQYTRKYTRTKYSMYKESTKSKRKKNLKF